MKCDGCQNQATVHNLVIVNGKPKEQHLCESCAAKKGLGDGLAPVAQLLLQGIKHITAEAAAERAEEIPAISCQSCGLTLAHFRHSGLLGCPTCYDAFAAQLGPLLDRAHDGATSHTGKIPGRLLTARATSPTTAALGAAPTLTHSGIDLAEYQRRENALRKQLDAAVAAEQFERAACLRDELLKLVNMVASGTTDDPASSGPASEGNAR